VPVSNANQIEPRLWQGAKPPVGRTLALAKVDLLVLAAHEHQPSSDNFPGVTVLHAPLEDTLEYVPRKEALEVATRVASAHGKGACILVTCFQGWNRSGLITALALWMRSGKSGSACRRQVQARRPHALCNPTFADYLDSLQPIALIF
jgi:protein-tyrosine phosphatase